MTDIPKSINRREALKKGALVGGAVLWITPVVQMVQMGPAYASDVSPGGTTSTTTTGTTDPNTNSTTTVSTGTSSTSSSSGGCEVYCIGWAPTSREGEGVWYIVDRDGCMPKHRDSVGRLPYDIDEFDVEYDVEHRTYSVTYPECYSLMRSGDPTPDDLVDGSASIRGWGSCRFRSIEHQEPGRMYGTKRVKFESWDANDRDRIELTLKGCCSNGDRS